MFKFKLRLFRIFPQLVVLGFLAILQILSAYGTIPTPEELSTNIENLFSQHGLPLVALCSFLENIVGVNAYFPGSIAILAGMALTAGKPLMATKMYFAIVLPALAANHLSYWLGARLKTQAYISSQAKEGRALWLVFLSTYWHPHLAATTAMASGARRLPYTLFLRHLVAASTFWSLTWALTLYYFGHAINIRSNLSYLFYAYLLLWTFWDLLRPIK